MYTQDTISAIATPPGTGGVGIIRVSGQQALALAGKLFRPRRRTASMAPGRMYYGDFIDKNAEVIDTGYFVLFKKPRSFTGEDIVEFHCHGGIIIMQTLLRTLFAQGVRPAEPGEFSKRAFLNGRIDLVQAEAISDLINAQSTRAADIARSHFRGKLSEIVDSIRGELACIIAWLEAEIDYPDTEIDYPGRDNAERTLQTQVTSIKQLENTYQEGKIYREGIVTVILGKPNVGKSSLLNSLAGEERAIVTDIPGTTRDVVEVPVNIRGIPLRLADTAGIRDSMDKIEKIGIDRARSFAAKADLILLVLDGSRPLMKEDLLLLDAAESKSTIVLMNKTDLPSRFSIDEIRSRGFGNIQAVSVLAGTGIEELKDAIESMFVSGHFQPDVTLITNQRHFNALHRAREILEDAILRWDDLPMDLLALDLRESWQILGEVTGALWSEDLLDCIFSTFCLGK